jgi:sirohydrochlorin ferrochelatase
MLGADKGKFWNSPPSWALPLDQNSDVIDVEQRRAERAAAEPGEQKKTALGSQRRSSRSGYLG